MKITPLGSMGWIPTGNRHTCCYALELPKSDTLILLDAGTGIVRFHEPWAQTILKNYDNVLVLLSHYHLDHIMGLVYLPFFMGDKKVCVAGPGKDIYGRPVMEILNDFTRPPFLGRKFQDLPIDLEVKDLGIGATSINGIKIETILQQHSDPTIGIKVAGDVCYLTDTTVSPQTVDFVSGSRVLLHETWLDQLDYETLEQEKETSASALKLLNSHSAVHKVVDVAIAGAVEQLVLIHLNPGYDVSRLERMAKAAQKRFTNAHLARDGVTVKGIQRKKIPG